MKKLIIVKFLLKSALFITGIRWRIVVKKFKRSSKAEAKKYGHIGNRLVNMEWGIKMTLAELEALRNDVPLDTSLQVIYPKHKLCPDKK